MHTKFKQHFINTKNYTMYTAHPPWHGARTCKVSRKYINAFSSYSAKTKRDGRIDGRTDVLQYLLSRAFGAAGDNKYIIMYFKISPPALQKLWGPDNEPQIKIHSKQINFVITSYQRLIMLWNYYIHQNNKAFILASKSSAMISYMCLSNYSINMIMMINLGLLRNKCHNPHDMMIQSTWHDDHHAISQY